MVKTTLTHDRSQAGFTLVELAIVMIIIGLLIGGILKGQELIANAQVTATAAQVKAVESAMTTFLDSYNAVPGDMVNANTRLPNCAAAPCHVAGTGGIRGNNRVDELALGAVQTSASENGRFWSNLAAADMVGGVSSTSTDVAAWGGQLPAAEIGGGFSVAYATGTPAGAAGTIVAGHYLALQLAPGTATGATASLSLLPTQAARIDRKLDDGVPTTGGVVAFGASGAANCWTDGANATYNEAVSNAVNCGLYARVQ